MTFDEWLNELTANSESRRSGIRYFVGSTRYPGVEKLLADAYQVGYKQGHNDMAEEFPTWDLREQVIKFLLANFLLAVW